MHLIKTNLGVCYRHTPSNTYYNNNSSLNKIHDPETIVPCAVLLELTSEFVNNLRSKPYFMITNEGCGISDNVSNSINYVFVSNENVRTSTIYRNITDLHIPDVDNIGIDAPYCLPKKQLPSADGIVSPSYSDERHVVFIGRDINNNFFFRYYDYYYDAFTLARVDVENFTPITPMTNINGIVEINSSNGKYLIGNVQTYGIDILFRPNDVDINIDIESVRILKKVNTQHLIPRLQFDIFPTWDVGLSNGRFCLAVRNSTSMNDAGNLVSDFVMNMTDCYDMYRDEDEEEESYEDDRRFHPLMPGISAFVPSPYPGGLPMRVPFPSFGLPPMTSIPLSEPEPDFRLNALDMYFAHLYGLPVELPQFIILNGLKVDFIPYSEAAKIDIQRVHFEPSLQPYAGLSTTRNRIITIFSKNGMTYLTKATYNHTTQMMFPPI